MRRMTYKFCLLVYFVTHMTWAQEDTSASYQPSIGERAAALPYLPQPPRHTHRGGDRRHYGGGGDHSHKHGSSNKELSTSIAHLSSDVKKLGDKMESQISRLIKNLEDMQEQQRQLVTMLLLGGGAPMYPTGFGQGRGKRAADDYIPIPDFYEPTNRVYTTTTEPPPLYATRPPNHLPFFSQPKITHATDNVNDYNPVSSSPKSRKVQLVIPGQLDTRQSDDTSGSLPGYESSRTFSSDALGYSAASRDIFRDTEITRTTGYVPPPPMTYSNPTSASPTYYPTEPTPSTPFPIYPTARPYVHTTEPPPATPPLVYPTARPYIPNTEPPPPTPTPVYPTIRPYVPTTERVNTPTTTRGPYFPTTVSPPATLPPHYSTDMPYYEPAPSTEPIRAFPGGYHIMQLPVFDSSAIEESIEEDEFEEYWE